MKTPEQQVKEMLELATARARDTDTAARVVGEFVLDRALAARARGDAPNAVLAFVMGSLTFLCKEGAMFQDSMAILKHNGRGGL